jgi:BirA family transcriptional regulator, biotin operon repressor / biotin---[acetyl-CoA-carboxylase] ligase
VEVSRVEKSLKGLPLVDLRYFDKIGSTNEEALAWAQAGALDMALVIANEQTAGRGRLGRSWFTPPDAALAISLVLRPPGEGIDRAATTQWNISRYTALGSLAVCLALKEVFSLRAMIKWPNDVLLEGRKVAGVLAEALWVGGTLEAVVLGIGVNVQPASVPAAGMVNYPATCVEAVLGRSVDRLELLRWILLHLVDLRGQLSRPGFIEIWQDHLAFLGEWVDVQFVLPSGDTSTRSGWIRGLDAEGRLRLQDQSGEISGLAFGEILHQTFHFSKPAHPPE